MSKTDAAQRIADLVAKLHQYNHEYHVLARPSVSDREYDTLFDELVRLETDHPELERSDSPTQRVGSDLSQELPEVAHTVPVLSLDKAYSADEISAWIEKVSAATDQTLSFTFEEKIDGSSIVLYYERGVLVRAVTRGNGEVGNDVSGNVRTIRSLPLRLPEPVDAAVRGEIFLPLEEFARLNAAAEVAYANPRNFAAGAVRRVKSRDVAAIPLRLFVYDATFADLTGSDHATAVDRLRAWGFPVNPASTLLVPDDAAEDARTAHPEWQVGVLAEAADYLQAATDRRPSLGYEIDGVVVKVNELEAREALGVTGHHPRWAIAFKFDAPEGETVVEGIEVQVGRTGRITPVARVAPVLIAGSTISNVTLHNQDYIESLELAIGDRVAVSKRGDVIPAVERVLDSNELGYTTWHLPPACPTCGTDLELIGAHHFCPNQQCPDQVRGRVHFFAARGQMDIDNLGYETLDQLIDRGVVTDIDEVFTFDVDQLLEWPGFGERKVALIKEGIERSRKRPFHVVLRSLGMPEIGPKVTELLIGAGYRDMAQMLALAAAGDPEPLVAIDGIGDKTAATIIEQLTDPSNLRRIDALRAAGLNFVADPEYLKPVPTDGLFGGQSWCVTGSFASFKPRDLAVEEIKERGGRITASVTSRTTHLLAGSGAGSKLEKAQQLGVTVVSEVEFRQLIDAAD